MNIRNSKEICDFSARRLADTPAVSRIALIFAGLILGLQLVNLALDLALEWMISQTGGLSSMGSRSMLSAIQVTLPMVRAAAVICLELGFLSVMLRTARGQYISPNGLRLGFDRFWPLLRLTLLKGLLTVALGFVSLYGATMLFLLLPVSRDAVRILLPMATEAGIDPHILVESPQYAALEQAMLPATVLWLVLFCVLAVPVLFPCRMAELVLIDKPGIGALAALRDSRRMLRGKLLSLLKLDLRLWRYYGAMVLTSVLGFLDQLLPAFGVELPFSPLAAYFAALALSMAAAFCVCAFLRPRAEVCYAVAYDSLRPRETPREGVVLGNIFRM